MKKMLIATAVMVIASLNARAGEPKDAIVLKSPEGKCYEIKAPHDVATVKQTGPNSRDVTVNKEALKKIEIRPVPCPKNP